MLLGKVVARVVSTARHSNLPSRALLEVDCGSSAGTILAYDGVGAGPGETVLVLQEGTGAREVLGLSPDHALPAQAVVVGIVDAIQQS